MKQRKNIAALSLLLAGCICLSACEEARQSLPPARKRRKRPILHKARIHPL